MLDMLRVCFGTQALLERIKQSSIQSLVVCCLIAVASWCMHAVPCNALCKKPVGS